MSSIPKVALECKDHLIARIKTIPPYNTPDTERVHFVASESDLITKVKGCPPPFCGVVYEGIRPTNDNSNQGLSNEISFSILILHPDKGLIGAAPKDGVLEVLDDIRNLFKGQRSPTAHKWVFRGEMPAKEVNGCLVWFQRWATAAII